MTMAGDLLEDPRVQAELTKYADEKLTKENDNLRGLIRRLEKSNQELGEENHRLKGAGVGWNQNT